MKLTKTLLALAFGFVACGSAQAVLYNGSLNTGAGFDGLLAPVSGFDIFSNGSAAFFQNGVQLNPASTTPLDTTPVTVYYQGVVNVVNPGTTAPNLDFPGHPGTYQLTVAATFQESVFFQSPGLAILTPLDGGMVSLFYDNTALSNTFIDTTAEILAGVGYTDGTLLASGPVSQAISLNTTFTSDGTNAGGQANINGPLTFAKLGSLIPDVVGFIPVPGGFVSTTTLQFGTDRIGTDYQTVNFFDAANGFTPQAVNPDFVLRADANVDLSAAAVPEPGTLALFGVALAGLGLIRRRFQA